MLSEILKLLPISKQELYRKCLEQNIPPALVAGAVYRLITAGKIIEELRDEPWYIQSQ